MRPIEIESDVTPARFAVIRERGEPVVMRGLVADWPLVEAARGDRAPGFLGAMASDGLVPFMRAAPEIEGRLHYGEGVGGKNFERCQTTLVGFIDQLVTEGQKARPDALALQGMPASERLPGFAQSHPMPLLPPDVPPRLWIGNAAKVAIHHDPAENIACVAAGRRRFTLFPPEQVGNLYMGPFHQTPAGVQVSLVHVTDPDLDRFPRFARALDAAVTAELEPGDALYIPYHWYHHVEALETFNLLVNYWWDAAPAGMGSPWDVMLHAMTSLRALPPMQRRAWQAMFDHYVFISGGDPGAHLPEADRGVLTPPSPRSFDHMRRALVARLRGD